MLRAIVIDDEKPSREVICNYLREYCSDVQVVTTASSVKIGYKTIMKFKPDLVFLDIELGDGNGFDLLKMFDRIPFKLIFVTAFSEHAIRAFRVNAIDYLLKPIKIDELEAAVKKVKNLSSELTDTVQIAALIKSMSAISSSEPTLIIPHTKGYDVLKVNEIIMCRADGYCTEFYLTGKRKVMSTKNLKQYESFLAEHYFLRAHHSYLINLNHVRSCTKQGEIDMTEGTKASLADPNRNKLLQILKSGNF
jgi:two-component system, LytTR family, response regulator